MLSLLLHMPFSCFFFYSSSNVRRLNFKCALDFVLCVGVLLCFVSIAVAQTKYILFYVKIPQNWKKFNWSNIMRIICSFTMTVFHAKVSILVIKFIVIRTRATCLFSIHGNNRYHNNILEINPRGRAAVKKVERWALAHNTNECGVY